MVDQAMEANERAMSRRAMVGRVGGGASVAALVALGLQHRALPAAAQDDPIADAWAAAWSSLDGEQVAAVFAPDGVYEDVPTATTVQGSAEISEWARGYFAELTEVTQTIPAATATPDGVVAEWLVEATHRETGNALSYRGVSILTVADGLITRETAYYDNATYIAQTGGTCAEAVTSSVDGTPGATPEA